MKKLGLAVFGLAAVCALATSNADAQMIKQNPGLTRPIITAVQGSINVTIPAQLSGLSCSDITVRATSVEMLPVPPGSFATDPKWTRTTKATGGALGACSYSMTVPGNSAMHLAISGRPTTKCMIVIGQPSPNAYVSVTVLPGTTKTFDFASTMLCQNIH
jgi:hypothetical protein